MTADAERLRLVKHALGGQHLAGWWADDWKAARQAAISGGGAWVGPGECGELQRDGVHLWHGTRYVGPPPDLDERDFESRVRPADVIVTWREIHEVVKRGATPERREAYLRASAAYVEQAIAPLPHPMRWPGAPEGWDYFQDPENEAHWAANGATIRALHAASDAIIEAGCAAAPVQDDLFTASAAPAPATPGHKVHWWVYTGSNGPDGKPERIRYTRGDWPGYAAECLTHGWESPTGARSLVTRAVRDHKGGAGS